MATDDAILDPAAFELIRFETRGRVLIATIDAPPMQVMTVPLYNELRAIGRHLGAAGDDLGAAGDDLGVLVVRSADPDFFIAHFDVEVLVAMPTRNHPDPPTELGPFHVMCEQFRTSPVVTIAEINGRIGGGGAELAASFDLRFGSRERMVLNQMEVPIGILPGGSGTQRLPRLIGRGRALEVVLGGVDLRADDAEAWGWLNRALPEGEVTAHVDWLADRIASHPPHAVRAAKAAVLAADPDPTPGLLEEAHLFASTMAHPDARDRMQRFLDLGGQTRSGEQGMEHLTAEVNRAAETD